MKRRRWDELRPEYDLTKLKGGVRGRYTAWYKDGTNLVLLLARVLFAMPGVYFPEQQTNSL
jgi:hypothetical protein